MYILMQYSDNVILMQDAENVHRLIQYTQLYLLYIKRSAL